MGRIKKSTRKFEAKHLKKTLEDRKAHAKVKQRHQLAEKRRKKRADGNDDEDAEEQGTKKAKRKHDDVELFEDMSIEQFFQGGFEVPPTEKEKKRKKRKREEIEKKGNDEEEEGEEGGEGDEELETHKADLAALAEKDPEFFKFLQENDSELLDFTTAERDDLSGIDIMSEGESGDEAPKKKKKKKPKKSGDEGPAQNESAGSSIEVTMKDVETWKKALVEEKSLRSLKKVVLAFRAAAHVNDVGDNDNGYKYSITDANGMLSSLRFGLCDADKNSLS